MLRRLPPPPPRSRCLRMLDAISIGIIRGLKIVEECTSAWLDPVSLSFMLTMLFMLTVAIAWSLYLYLH